MRYWEIIRYIFTNFPAEFHHQDKSFGSSKVEHNPVISKWPNPILVRRQSSWPHRLCHSHHRRTFRPVSSFLFRLPFHCSNNHVRGLSTTTALASKNAKVYIASRSSAKAKEAILKHKELNPNVQVEAVQMDLGDLRSVKKGAEEFLK